MNSSSDDFPVAIDLRSVRVRRGGRIVLPAVDLHIRTGSITGLLGPSGSGKTTLMRAIVGTQIVDAGDVVVLGVPAGTPQLRERVGYVTQAPSVYSDLTVRENLAYFARVVRAPRDRISQVIEDLGLSGQADQVASTLSGGERSRASLACALLAQPELLILDEPTVGLDPVLRRDLWQIFRKLARAGTTIVLSTHVMDEAERCDDLVLMRDGKIIAVGSPKELRRRTQTDNVEDAFLRLAAA